MSRSFFSYGKVQRVVSAILRNNRAQCLSLPPLLLMNVGCGDNIHSNFLNIDYNWRKGIDLCWDIKKRLPLRESSMVGIFTEHCLEHVSYDECLVVLQQIHKILKPGGVLRVIVPDGGLYLDLYHRHQAGEPVEFPYVDSQGATDLALDSRLGFTPMMAVNRIFRGYGHEFAYDYETMENMLRHVGFRQIERCTYRSGSLESLLIDSEMRAPQSLFLEATK